LVPSKHKELSRFEFGSNGYRGYIHHRWIYTINNGYLTGIPKLGLIEYLPQLDEIADTDSEIDELRAYWFNSVGLRIVNEDYMGPDVKSVVRYYNMLFSDDLIVGSRSL